MSRWSEEFKNDDIHKKLSDTLELLSTNTLELLSTNAENIDVEFAAKFEDEKRRLIKVISMIDKAVKGIDAECFPLVLFNHTFTKLVEILKEICGILEEYPTEDSAQLFEQLFEKLTNVNNNLTDIMPEILTLPGLARSVKAREVIKGTEDAFENFTKNMEDTAGNFQTKLIENTAELDALSPTVNELGGKLKELEVSFGQKLAAWQAEFTGKEKTCEEEYSEYKKN